MLHAFGSRSNQHQQVYFVTDDRPVLYSACCKHTAHSHFTAFKRLIRLYAVRPNKSCNSYDTEPPGACYNCPVDADTSSALHGMHPKHLLACTCRQTCIRCCCIGCYQACLLAACLTPQGYVQMQPVFAGKLLFLPTFLLKDSHPAQHYIVQSVFCFSHQAQITVLASLLL